MKRRIAIAAAQLAVAGFAAVIVLGFVPIWPCTLLEHFRVQCLFGGLAVAVAAYWLPRGWFDAAMFALLVDALVVVPDLSRSAAPASGMPVRFLFANVLTSNTHYDRVRALVDETKPDVIAFVETNQVWFDNLAPSLVGYQKLEHPRADNFGLAIYARGGITGRVEYLGGDLPTIVAEVTLARQPTTNPTADIDGASPTNPTADIDGAPPTNPTPDIGPHSSASNGRPPPSRVDGVRISIVVTHPWPPMSGEAEAAQHVHLDAVAARIAELRRPVIFAGDFNATPWSRPFARVVGATGLCDTRAGFGYQGTYPSSSVILRIPIDHVMVSCGVGVRDRWIGPHVGSDHLPVIVDLLL